MDGVYVRLVFGSRLIYAKLCGIANLAPSHRPYTRISWVCPVTQAMAVVVSLKQSRKFGDLVKRQMYDKGK